MIEPTLMEAPPPGIEAMGLARAFGDVRAVDGITFTAPAGAVTALIGPNGSGKTTLLLLLSGLLKPDAGKAIIAGHDVESENLSARSHVGWMPDAFGTWDALTCTEILTTFAHAYGIPRAGTLGLVDDLLRRVHLTEFAHRPARVLSRGQKQRLGLARALVHDPQVLLLDEPASGLDPRSRIELRDLLRDLAREGKTVLVSSHVLSELEELYDHAVFLSRGRTVDASAAGASGSVQRGWRLDAIDPVGLRTFLDDAGIPWTGQPNGEVVVQLSGYDSARELVRAAVGADVSLHTISPVSGRLEETYLSLNEERV
ncbi:MAG TPA: ABC transporter ATP-binding protein [Propionicimonas sp.]|nr:ABC transporter ATP-binding protein [Propionicimonas sp.]HQA77419.1 ABC transporter ATP-binding protein [Propionicimonas sp.]HQD96745.1 ABC transporter ATP-binding protein [Propionicimonas sp.]